MDVESTITLILGTGFVASLITLLGTYFLNRKQKEKDRKSMINDKMIANVYSPFYFYIFQIIENVGSIIGNFTGVLDEKDAPIELSKRITIDRLKEVNCPLFCSTSMREMLSLNIGFIKPEEFRRELAFYFMVIKSYEDQINRFVNEGFNDDLEAEKMWVSNMVDASTTLVAVSAKFLINFDKLMTNEGNQSIPLAFKSSLPNETFRELNQKILSRNALYVKSYEEKTRKSKKNKSA